MTWQTALPIMTAILSALAGLIVWVVQREFERRQREHLRREELYLRLLNSFLELRVSGNVAPFLCETQRAWLYASDEVLRLIHHYWEVFQKEQTNSGSANTEARNLVENRFRVAIRRDLHRRTQLDPIWFTAARQPLLADMDALREYLNRQGASEDEATP